MAKAKGVTTGGPARSTADDVRLADLRWAAKQIGTTMAENLHWVARFAAEEPPWHSTEALQRGDGLLALIHAGRTPYESRPPMPAADVHRLHGEIRAILRGLVGEKTELVRIPLGRGLQIGLFRPSRVDQHPATYATNDVADSVHDTILLVVRHLLLSDEGRDLVRCAGVHADGTRCPNAVVRTRKRIYCSLSCSQRARDARRRGPTSTTRKGATR